MTEQRSRSDSSRTARIEYFRPLHRRPACAGLRPDNRRQHTRAATESAKASTSAAAIVPLIEQEQGSSSSTTGQRCRETTSSSSAPICATRPTCAFLRTRTELAFSILTIRVRPTTAHGGLDLATFLFGETTAFNRYVGSPTEQTAMETQNRYFLYAQDTWRATQKLTVNYGLRWEFYTPENVNGKGNGGFAVFPEGVIRVAGYGGIGMNGNTADNYKQFAPRLGIAYEITPKTVVRMGYGRSYDIGVFGSLFGHTVTQNLPVLANQTINGANQRQQDAAAFNFIPATGPATRISSRWFRATESFRCLGLAPPGRPAPAWRRTYRPTFGRTNS